VSLLRELQDLTERTYSEFSGINLEEFVIGQSHFRHLSALSGTESAQLSEAARVFFREANDRLYLAVYFSNQVICSLENNDPRRGLNNGNIIPFIVFMEEIDHCIHGSLKYIEGKRDLKSEVFIRDLELLAKIDVYQVLKFFLAWFNGSGTLEGMDRLWLRHHLFERQDTNYESTDLSERYEETGWLGEKFSRFVDGLTPESRLQEMRMFRNLCYEAKADYIRLLPN